MTQLVTLFIALAWAKPAPNIQFQDVNRGIELKVHMAQWEKIPSSDEKLILALGRKGQNSKVQRVFTVRVDVSPQKSARAYGEFWLRQMPKFGLEMEFARPYNIGQRPGYEMRLKSLNGKNILHQLILESGKEKLIFTCADSSSNFEETYKGCQEIISKIQITDQKSF